jgi:hypothetical protein
VSCPVPGNLGGEDRILKKTIFMDKEENKEENMKEF